MCLLDRLQHFVRHHYVDLTEQALASKHICLITGDPGVGKSALAGYLALQHKLTDSTYDIHWISDRRIGDALSLMQAGSKGIYVLDDFLGATFLSSEGALGFADDLCSLISLIRRANGDFKLLLTTRDYILEQAMARIGTDHPAFLQLSQHAVKLQHLDLRVRSEILHSLLQAASLKSQSLKAIVETKVYHKIIRHRHFNPRLLQALLHRLGDAKPASLAKWVVEQLDNPRQLWLRPFQDLSDGARCILHAIAMSREQASTDDLRDMFHALYRAQYGRLSPAGSFDAALLEIEPNFALSDAHCDATWYRLSNGSIEDLLHNVIQNDRELIDILIQHFDRFEFGLQLFKLYPEDTRPIQINDKLRHHLFEQLVQLLDTPKQRLTRRMGAIDQDQGWVIHKTPYGQSLCALWAAAMPSQQAISALLPKLKPLLGETTDWKTLFSKGHTATLLSLLEHLSPETQTAGWAAARKAMLNSEDAAAIANVSRNNAKAAAVLTANRRKLRTRMETVCLQEIDRATDEAHVGAVLEDIATIEDALGFNLNFAKTTGYQQLHTLLFDDIRDDEDNNPSYYEAPDMDEKLDWLKWDSPEITTSIDEIFEELMDAASYEHDSPSADKAHRQLKLAP